jgi:hypothetical protein
VIGYDISHDLPSNRARSLQTSSLKWQAVLFRAILAKQKWFKCSVNASVDKTVYIGYARLKGLVAMHNYYAWIVGCG